MTEFERDQQQTARDLGYGDDVAAMNREHDPLHYSLCAWLQVPSYSMVIARGEPVTKPQAALAAIEEAAVLAVQRLMRAHGVDVPAVLP